MHAGGACCVDEAKLGFIDSIVGRSKMVSSLGGIVATETKIKIVEFFVAISSIGLPKV